MTRPIFISQLTHKVAATPEKKTPRDRYVQYVNDLYKIYPGKASPESFIEGDQLTYAELGELILEAPEIAKTIKDLDNIIVAHWSQEFDPDYASCGPYFLHKYDLKSDIFDVCDQGTLAPFMAAKILFHYQKNNVSDMGMILCLEQTTIPRDKSAGDVIPLYSGASAILLTSDSKFAQWLIKNIEFICEEKALEKLTDIASLITSILKTAGISINETSIVARKNTCYWKALKHQMLSTQTTLREQDDFQFISPNPGCLSAFKKIEQITNQPTDRKFLLVIDEDVESMNMAYMLLEKCNDTV